MRLSRRRKSPYRHPVREHKRQGYDVHKYMRGQGNQVRRLPRRVVAGNPTGGGGEFTVRFAYDDKYSDIVSVKARTTILALQDAFGKRETIDMPRMVTITAGG